MLVTMLAIVRVWLLICLSHILLLLLRLCFWHGLLLELVRLVRLFCLWFCAVWLFWLLLQAVFLFVPHLLRGFGLRLTGVFLSVRFSLLLVFLLLMRLCLWLIVILFPLLFGLGSR